MGLLLGYLAEQQKRLRAEKSVIARFLARIRVETGLAATLQEFLGDLMSMYGAEYALMASQEIKSHHAFVGEARSENGAPPTFRWLDSQPTDRDTYLFETGAETCYISRDGRSQASKLIALDHQGTRVRNLSLENWKDFSQRYEFDSLAMVSFLFGQEWWGRIFLLNSSMRGDIEEELRFLRELIHQTGPAVYNVYLLRRLRQRAGAVERARFARELHDGAVQSLIAVEMQVDVLRRQSAKQPEIIPEELGRIQGLLREEVLKLRELMQQMKSLDVDSRRLLRFLADTVERFQRETGIAAHFHAAVDHLEMPQQVCRELAAIVQEGLVNVRKHSRAKQVLVRFTADNGAWNVVIEDNGCGFSFAGRMSLSELDGQGKGPVVIKERIRVLEGDLTINSDPGRGSRLEITIPQRTGT
jgi:signal transduction histidine kinase